MPFGMPDEVLTWRGWESVKIIFEDDYKYLIEQAMRALKNAEDLEDMDKQLAREQLIKNEFQQGIEEQGKRIKELEQVLEFYADEQNYLEMVDQSGVETLIEEDNGKMARQIITTRKEA